MPSATISIYQADAFTDQLFGGNPAAVCPLTAWLPDGIMQQIAAENNLAETAFFVRKSDDFNLRWLTPEIDLCGHAILASAHIIFTELKHSGNAINFHTVKAMTLLVSRKADQYTLDFPSRPAAAATIPEELISALGN
ncbi:MAG: PhzF family phenazine biosynthesis protein [Sphingobacteriaceae bacterium]